MSEELFFRIVLYAFAGVGSVVFVVLFFITAPYGRHVRRGWGPELNGRLGWVIMEAVSPIGFFVFFMLGDWKTGVMPYVFLGLWLFHYLYRSFLFPSLIRGDRKMPLSIICFAVLFNTGNTYVQGTYLYSLSAKSAQYPTQWLWSPAFIIGVVIFLTGFVIHVTSDSITRGLRKPGESGYRVPYGGLYRWVSCPNYLGEIIQWIGWAVLTWSISGLVFAFWTAANLLPRARSNHRWYRESFPEYPRERKALIPFLL
jgi:protein-S-isoprenylcysteine O-methyltransferase Ste14